MEEEQRKKKLEAGKERLAAFRKKKAKKKKKPASGDDTSSNQGADGNLADASSCSDVQSLTGDSDQGSLGSYTSGDEWSAEEADLHSAVYYQTRLVDASRRVSELEEMVEGKQLALDKVVQENTQLKEQQKLEPVEMGSSVDEVPRSKSDTMVNTTDLRSALVQRDQIIQQLTARLRATAEKTSQDYTQETQTLAQQVALLQQQLQQAGATLHGQLNQHNVSAQALQEAKAEILALQNLLREKEDILAQLTIQVSQKTEEAVKLQLLCQEQQLKEQRLVEEHEMRMKEFESSICQHETKTTELAQKYEQREKELVLCAQQHEAREKELEVYVNQCASNEIAFQETIVKLEGQLATVVKEKEIVMTSLESSGHDEQQKIAKLTLELESLGQEKDTAITELEQIKSRNNELESLCKEMEELQSECSLKQSENDELRNKINDQQGETLSLKSQLELLLQDEDSTGHELEVLRELMDTKEKVHEAELQEKNTLITQLQTSVKTLEDERSSYTKTIETLNSQILSLQSDLKTSLSEVVTYKGQAEMFEVELKRYQEGVLGNKLDGTVTDQMDGADAFAVESELEVRRVGASVPPKMELESTVEDLGTLFGKKVLKNVTSEESQRVLQESSVKTETAQSLGASVSVIGDGGSITKSLEIEDTDSQLVSLNQEITRLKQMCTEYLVRISELESRNSFLETELETVKGEVAESTAKEHEMRAQNDILVNQHHNSGLEIHSLSSELRSTCDKLKERHGKCDVMSKELSDQRKENLLLVSKLEQVEEEKKVIQTQLSGTELTLRELEQESSKVRADLESQCSDYQNQLKQFQESVQEQEDQGVHCEEHEAEICRLKKELTEAKTGLEEVTLGAEKTQEDLENQCDQYAAEAAELQGELTKAQQALSQDKDQINTFEEKCHILSNEMSFLQEELTKTKEELSLAQERLAKEQKLHSVLREQDDRDSKDILQLQKELDSVRSERAKEQEKSKSSQEEIARLTEELEKSSSNLNTKFRELEVLRGQLDSQSTDSLQIKEALESEKVILEQMELDLRESESQREILASEVTSSQQQLLSVCAETMNLKLQTSKTDKKMTLLQKLCTSQEEMITELKIKVENADKQSAMIKEEFDASSEKWKSNLNDKESEVSKLKEEVSELIAAQQSADINDRDNQQQLQDLKEENVQYRKEIEHLTVQQLSSQELAEEVSSKLQKVNLSLVSKQSELDQANAKLQELCLGAEQSQAELQVKCVEQASEIAKLTSEKSQVQHELDKVLADAEIERAKLQTKVELLQTEIGSLQRDCDQMKLEHSRTLAEERHVTANVRSQLDVASAEATEQQKALDVAGKEVSEAKSEMEKLRSDYEVQLKAYLANIEELKSETKISKTEIDQLSTKLQCEEDAKVEIQTWYEKSVSEMQSLQNDLKISREEFENMQVKMKTLEEVLNIEQAARMELQSHFESMSSEFDRVNSSEKKLKKDNANNFEKIMMLIGLTTISVENSQELSASNMDEVLQVLEESVSKLKFTLEEQITSKESLTENVSELESANSELNNRLAAVTESEETLKSEIEEVKAELQNTKSQMTTSSSEVKTCQTKIESLQEEKEILKANFDSCMVDMQQKLSEQENQSRSLQSKLMEMAKDKDRDNNEVKQMYEDHITELEEKLLKVEAEFTQATKIISEYNDSKSTAQENHESKIVELEEKLSSLETENTRLQEQQSKFSENFQQEKEDIKSIFESQICELEENCKSLETTMLRLQDQHSEATKSHEQEKEQIEQNYDIQLSEVEDKCRVLEMTNGKLKRQMDEMLKDFTSEKEDLKKLYETQIIDLEDRCSQSELTANKSMQHVSDISKDYGDEKETYVLKIQDLEERCFELEKNKEDALDRLELVTESAHQERKTLQESMSEQLTDLQKQHTVVQTEYTALKEVLQEREQTHKVELETLKNEYQSQISTLEEKCLQLTSQCDEKVQTREYQEASSLQQSTKDVDDIDGLRKKNENYKAEIGKLTAEKEEVNQYLETERQWKKEYTLLEKECADLKSALEEKEVSHKEEVETLMSEYQNKITILEEKCLQLHTHHTELMSENVEVESIQALDSNADDIASLKATNERYKSEIECLLNEKKEFERNLENEREHFKIATDKIEELRLEKDRQDHQTKAENMSTEVETKNARELKDHIDVLNSKLSSSNQELNKEKQRLKASKLAVEKLKKELQNQKATSDEEIQSLKLRLEAWEVELIQRRQFVEKEKAEVELESLVKNYEQKVQDLSGELHHLRSKYEANPPGYLHLDVEPMQGVVTGPVPKELERSDSQITGAFEPEPQTPDPLKSQPEFPVYHADGNDGQVVQGFKPEESEEGFMVFETHPSEGHTGASSSVDQNGNVQVESHSSRYNESLISGDGFQPEVDHSSFDTFQPETAGEFKPEEDLETESLLPVATSTYIPTFSVSTQTEEAENCLSSDLQSVSQQKVTPLNSVSTSDNIEVIKLQLQHEKDQLEEQYVQKMNKLKVDLQYDHQAAMKDYQKEVDKMMQQKLTAMKDEKHQAFIKALRKARKQLEEKHKKEVEKIRQEMSKEDETSSPESDLVKQLHKDNQELAEARDALLQEISHTQQSQIQAEEPWQSQQEHKSRTSSPKADTDNQDIDSPDRHQSERFLEELESLSQRSASDLPLEWELTVSTDDGVFDRDQDDDGLCARHECQEMKKKYQRLFGLYQQAQGESVFIEELSPDRNQISGLSRRQRIDSSEQESDTTGSSHLRAEAANTSQDVSEGDYFEESFKDKIQKLEAENIALEKKLCDQLEMFSVEKQQLKQRCEILKINLDTTSSSQQNVEEKLVKQHGMIQSSLSQLSALGNETASVETQTELSGDISLSGAPHGLQFDSVSGTENMVETTDEILDTTLSSKQNDISTANMSTPKSQKKNVKTELNFGESHAGISMVEHSEVSSTSSPTDSFFLPSIDHIEHVTFSDSDSNCQSPTGRTPMRQKRKEQPIEISFNTKSLVSVKCTEGGTIVNDDKIELTGTVNSAGTIVPEEYAKVALEIHHAEMVEEISRLKQELHDSKALYARENALLKEQVEREHTARQLWLEMKVPDEKRIKELPLQTDVIELRKEVAVLKENNKMLMDDNKHLLDQVREKECLMLHFRDKFDTEPLGLEDCSHGNDNQLLILQRQRDELVQEIKDFHEQHERLLSVLDARTAMEETLRREKAMLLEKLVQYEDAQSVSTEKHTELELLRGEQRRLEQLLLMKDENERQLLRQKRHMEEDMYEIEGKLKEREAFLEEEKLRLLKEVKEKNLTILKLETLTRSSDGHQGGPGGPRMESRRASTGHLAHGQPVRGQAMMSLDTSYDEAIEILRNKLKLEYEVKEAELNEQHASDKAAFWQQHNKKLESLCVQHESQMETLRSELDAERDRNSQHDLHLQEQHQQTVARLRNELEEEKASMLDTVLKQLGELTHRQIQQAKHENRTEVDLQVQAMKLTMEQIHTSQLNLIQAELEAKHAADMTNLRQTLTKELKEQRNSQESTLDKYSGKSDMGAIPDLGPVDQRLTERYEQLVLRINEQLEKQVLHELQGAPPGDDSSETNTSEGSPLQHLQAIRHLLESQREDISQLRSQLLTEYETVLQSRTLHVTSQSEQVEQLQREIEALQTQYQEQIKTFQEKLQHAAESDERVRTQEQQTKELEELRTYYEKKVQDMERTFSEEISELRTKYEDQISNMSSSTDVKDSGNLSDSKESIALAKEREYVQRTTMLTVITDSDESSATESPRGASTAVSRLSDLEKQIQERERKITDLEKLLEEEREKASLSAEEVKSLKDQLNEYEKNISELNVVISEKENVITDLNGVVSEKEKVISDLEDEREKYMNDLQEKEIKSDDSSSIDLAQEKHELLIKLEELEHRHKEELESVRHELEHENKVEVETMQSEFKVQMEIELKRQAAELLKIQEENVKNLEMGQQVVQSSSPSDFEGEVTPDVVQEVQTLPVKTAESFEDTDGASNGVTTVSDVVDSVNSEGDMEAQRKEYEAKIEKLKTELDNLQAENEEMSKKHQHELNNLKSLLTETEEKYDKLLADMDSGDNPEIEELLKEKYDQQLELSKQLMQQEFTETLESERSRFMERHRKMMDNFMSDRTQEAEELKAKHETELQELRDQLATQQAEVLQLRTQQAELEKVKSLHVRSGDEADGDVKEKKEDGSDGQDEDKDGRKDSEREDSNRKEDKEGGDGEQIRELVEKHSSELEELRLKWEKKLEDMKTTHTDEMSAAALDTEAVKTELETAHQKELENLESQLNQLHQREVERLREELQAVEERLGHIHQREMEQLRTEHQELTDKLAKQHKDELSKLEQQQRSPEHREPLREVSEVYLPPQTTPLLSATDLDSTMESETEAEFLMKSTPRDPQSDATASRGSTPDEMLVTRSFAQVVRGTPPVTSEEELKEKEEKIKQLEAELERVRSQLERVQSEEQLLTGRRFREAEEESNLVTMLRSDLDRISTERDAVQSANDRLLQVLSDSVKNYVSVEDAINKKLARLVNQSRSRPSSGTPREDRRGSDADHRRESRGGDYGARAASPRSDRGDPNTSQDSTALEETSILSSNTDEGLDVSQRLTESIFAGPELDPEGEEILTDARGRLQTSVTHLLEMIEKTTQQLLEAKKTQQELVETLASRSTESEVLQARCTEVEERLTEEVSAKEYLALELHKAEGLISGYSTERDGLEHNIESLEEQRQALALELETTQTKLQEFQNSQAEIQSRQDAVERQEQLLRENVGEETQALLQEVNTLTKDHRELEKQSKHQLERSQSRIHELELTMEEMERLHEQALEEKREEVEDIRLQLDSVERQLKASKQFLSEQSGEREQEREDYQREVERLQELLQDKKKKQSAQGRLQQEVQDLSEQLENRIASEGELDEQTRRLQQVLQDKELTAAELTQWVTQLEKEVEEKNATEQELRQKIDRLEKKLSLRHVADETSDSSLNSTAEQQYGNPDLMSPDRRSPIRRQITLEEELERSKKTGQELALEKEALQQQVQDQLLQISALKNQLDDMRHYGGEAPTVTHTSQLRERLAVERESLEMKEEEVSSLQEQKEKLRQLLEEREEEVQKLRAELSDVDIQPPVADSDQKVREENANLKAEVEKLLGHQEDDSADLGMPRFAQDLLDEKNHEIDDLTEQVSQLQMALEATSVIDDSLRENDEIELLREELRQKSETIAELQKLSSSQGGQFFGEMSLTDADRSLLETSFTEKTNFQQELEETIAQKEEEVSDLRKELETSQLTLTEIESEKITMRTELEQRVNELEEKLESAQSALKAAEDRLSVQTTEDKVETQDLEQVDDLKKELELAREALKNAEDKSSEGSEELFKLQTQLEETQQALKEAEEKLVEIQQTLKPDEENADISKLQKELEDSKEALNEAENNIVIQTELNAKLKKEVEELQDGLKTAEEKLKTHDTQTESELRQELEEVRQSLKDAEEQLTTQDTDLHKELKQAQQSLKEAEQALKEAEEKLMLKDNEKLNELQKELDEVQVALMSAGEEQESLRARLGERESELLQIQEDRDLKQHTLDQVNAQMDSFQEEIKSLTTFQNELQKDFDTVQSMLEEKEKEIETLTRELTESRVPPEGATSDLQDKYETEILNLKKTIQEKVNIIEEREEEMYVLNEKLELQESLGSELSTVRQQLADTEVMLDEEKLAKQQLEEELKSVQQGTAHAPAVSLSGDNAQESNTVSISQLQEQLSHKEEKLDSIRAEVDELKERLSEQQKELNDVQDQLQVKESLLDKLESGEKDGTVEQLQSKVTMLEEELQKVKVDDEHSQVEELKGKIQELEARLKGRDASGMDGGEVLEQDEIVVSFANEVEGIPTERDSSIEGKVDSGNETRNIVEQLNEKINVLEEELEEKKRLLEQLKSESTEETPSESDVQKQLREKTQLYDQLLTDKIILEKSVIELENKLEEKLELLDKMDLDKSDLSEKEELIAKLQQQLQDHGKSVDSEDLANLRQSVDEKSGQIQELERQCEDLRQQLAVGPEDLLTLQQQAKEKDDKIEELQTKYEDLKQQMREEASRLEEEIQKIHQIQENQPDFGVLEESQRKVAEMKAELELTLDKLSATETTLEQTLVQLAEKDEQLKTYFAKGRPQPSPEEETGQALEDAQQEVYELSLELREKDEDIERLQTSLTATEEELEKKSTQLRKTESELEKRTSLLRQTEETLKQKSFELTTAQQDNLSLSLPLDLGDSEQQHPITRCESEPTLNNWRRENTLFRSRLHEVESLARKQKQELKTKNQELSLVRKQLEQWLSQDRGEGDAGTLLATLQQDLQERDRNIQLLQAEIDELTETLILKETQIRELHRNNSFPRATLRESTPPESEQQIRHLKLELRKAKSALAEIHQGNDYLDRTPEGSATEEDQSPVRLGDEARSLRREVNQLKEELQLYKSTASMSAREFVKKVMELREELSEEHKNHIRDIQERLKMDAESQLTTLQLRHEDEIKQLRQIHDRKMQAALAEQKQELEKQHKSDVNRLISEHKHEIDLVRDEGLVRDDASVTDLRHSLMSDIQTTEQMDNRLMDQLERPDGVGGEDSDTSFADTSSVETGPPGVVSARLQTLLSRLHKKGVHMLTLSELQFLQRHMSRDKLGGDVDLDALRQAWDRERETLLSTINSLKDLLTRVHKTNSVDRTPEDEDWRGDLLTALCSVFDKEREALMAELRSYVVAHPQEADSTGKRLEQRISDQESLHRTALDQVHLADRQSLLKEIGAMRKKASLSRQQTDEQQQTYSDKLSALEDQSAKRERQQQRQIQVLEYKLQQEKVIQEDLKTSLDLERQRVRDVSGELSREKNSSLDIQGELSTVQIQLSKARDALEREHNRYTSVTDALEEERTKNSRLSELLEVEKRKCALLDSQVLDLRSHNKDYLEKESRFVEQLRIELEREREKRIEYARQAEQERGANHGAQQEMEEERRRMRTVQSESEALVAQLKLSLEGERAKTEDLNRNLEEEHQALTRLRSALDQERSQHQEAANQDRGVIEDIEARLRAEQTQVEDLHRSLAREKQKLASVSDMLETERENMRQTIEHERAVCRQLKRENDDLESERSDLKRQVEFERETVKTYQNQTEQLHEEVKVLKQRENEYQKRSDSQQGVARKTIRELERDRDQLNIKVHELEMECDRIRDKLQDTQLQLENVQGREMQVRHELDRVRLTTASHQTSPTRDRVSAPVTTATSSLRQDNLDNFIQRLEFLVVRMKDDPALTSQTHGDVVDAQVDASANYITDIQGLVAEMKDLRQPLSSNEVRSSVSAGQIANERIVKHNAELTTFLNRVCREKEVLRTAMESMEEELAKQRGQSRLQQVTEVRHVGDEEEEDRYLEDRMAWASERLSLQMSLDSAEHEIDRLQAEVRLVRSQLNSEGYLTEADREKMQRLYGKFLRAESFRKALVYQKRYLLLLLGGYQDCEQETLMLIAQMGGYPSDIDVQRRRRHTRFFSLFRSAARVIIAIARMRFMVRKWRRAIRVGSPVVSGRVNINLGYMPSTSSYSPPRPTSSPRHFPSMSRIPDFPRSSVSEPLIALNGDLANPYQPSTSGASVRRPFTTPPTKDPSASQRPCDSRSVTSSARRRVLQDTNSFSITSRHHRGAAADESTDDFLHRLENLQTRLGSYDNGVPTTRSTAWR